MYGQGLCRAPFTLVEEPRRNMGGKRDLFPGLLLPEYVHDGELKQPREPPLGMLGLFMSCCSRDSPGLEFRGRGFEGCHPQDQSLDVSRSYHQLYWKALYVAIVRTGMWLSDERHPHQVRGIRL